jgi:hypothetical protein
MRLSWNEIRIRAKKFSAKWADAHYERGETQTFYNEFFEIFGVERRRVARYEELVKKLDNRQGFIDLFWPKVLLVEQKSAGRDLAVAAVQAGDYFDAIKDGEKPRHQLLCDFQNFELLDRDTRQSVSFALSDLHKNIECFGFILGIEKRSFRDQDPVNVAASELMGEIHDALEESGYKGHDLERYLVRLVFMLFADDTGIFEPRDILLDFIESRTHEDGSDVGPWLNRLFEILNTPEEDRQKNLDEDLRKFPYVNGDLFSDRLPTADFNAKMRETLIEACRFNWSAVSPAIFGSLFQSVMNAEERRKKGAHYTTEKNIMKVIGPLFLDDLKAEFAKINARKDNRRKGELEAFRRRLGNLTFLDPACGCGNFLIIAYRELRLLEMEVIEAFLQDSVKLTGDSRIEQLLKSGASGVSVLDVDQFYGIEFEEFPARIAEVAMWMMDHIMNNRFGLAFNTLYARIPLKKSPHIRHADALEFDWNSLLPAHQCSYVFGNPPFIGAKYQSDKQRAQVRTIARLGGSGGTLDYVTAWFLKAGAYLGDSKAKIAFVATNSITQGEQVAQLWPLLFDRYRLEIAFAHRTFAWGSEARGVAHVHVVIIGMTRGDMEPEVKRLFSYANIKGNPVESRHKALTAYLFDAQEVANRHRVVEEVSSPLNGLPKQIIGSKPIDGGYLIFDTADERALFIAQSPGVEKLIRPFVGGDEFLYGESRWILALQQVSPTELAKYPGIRDRLRLVREYRQGKIRHKRRQTGKLKPPGQSAIALAATPGSYHVTVIPTEPFLALPEVSSEKREYLPIAWLEPSIIPSNKLKIVPSATKLIFGILTSKMHMAWLANIGGRLESRFQYSSGIVYNTFPWPDMSPAQSVKVAELAQTVLDARTEYPSSTLADLYDPDLMPPKLRKAHQALDLAVDRLYRRAPFASERERVEHLFGLYEKMVAPIEAAAKAKIKKRPSAKAIEAA